MRLVLALSIAVLAAGCGGGSGSTPASPGGATGIPPGFTSVPAPAPSATPEPQPGADAPSAPAPAAPSAPTASVDPGPIARIRVSFFGINCGKGVPVPRNSDQVLPIRCRGYVTATPKDANGDDVPKKVHGPDIAWELAYGEGVVEVQPPTFESDFNRDLVGLSSGAFGLCATVKGVRGCLEGNVQPR
jgi:hypothetical protein